MSRLKIWILARLSNLLIRGFGLITEDDILQIKSKDVWIHKGRQLTKGEIDNLKSEAEWISASSLWRFLTAEIRWHGQKKAIVDAKDSVDLIAARELLYLSLILESFIKNIKSK